MRFLFRLENAQGYKPKDVRDLQEKIRGELGSVAKIGNLRVSTGAIEFDLFGNKTESDQSKSILEKRISRVISLRPIDNRVSTRSESETLQEGVRLFNEERFWEAHEVLEDIWHPAKGEERSIIQGLILTAAAFVHYQRDETSVCVSILGRALEKMGSRDDFQGFDIKLLRLEIAKIIRENVPYLIRMETRRTKSSLHLF